MDEVPPASRGAVDIPLVDAPMVEPAQRDLDQLADDSSSDDLISDDLISDDSTSGDLNFEEATAEADDEQAKSQDDATPELGFIIDLAAKNIVDYMLFVNEAPLTSEITVCWLTTTRSPSARGSSGAKT